MSAAKSSRQRGYTWAWEKARAHFLHSHPLCRMCQDQGRLTAAEVVDHIVPHRGDPVLFWFVGNWQPLCKAHHDSTKRREETRGIAPGCDSAGAPLDPNHPWSKQR